MALIAEVIPDETHAAIKLANEYYNAGDIDKAAAQAEKILLKEPDNAQALTVLSAVLKKAGRYAMAYQIAKRATEIKPERPETWAALGACAQQLWRLDESRSAYRKAMQRALNNQQKSLYLNNIASVYLDSGEFKKAEPFCRDALKLVETDPMAQHNLGLSLLAQRKWRAGWPYYSASIGTSSRLNQKYLPPPGEPTWDGTKGKRVVVYGEQGLGDEICAASMLPDLINECRVVVDCDHRLEGLFKRSFPGARVYGTRWQKEGLNWDKEDRQIDASIASFEIGKFYRNEDPEFPGTPYLVADKDRSLMWRALFDAQNKPTIGIAWSGGTWQNAGQFRQLPLDEWAPIFNAVDAHWVSLQYKDASADINGSRVVQYPYGTLTKDYDDTAALVNACDLVICMQTTVGHLAGALGKPVWVMLPKTSQWRYGEDFSSVLWYRSMRLFRQGATWEPAIKEIVEMLRARYQAH